MISPCIKAEPILINENDRVPLKPPGDSLSKPPCVEYYEKNDCTIESYHRKLSETCNKDNLDARNQR